MMVVICANSLPPSSLRKQGPITTGVRCYERRLPSCPIETTRRRDERCRAHARGPRFRGDDRLRRSSLPPRIRPSSPGLTGRSSTPRLLDPRSGASGILDPRFRGDDRLRSSLPPQIRPSSSGLTGRSSTPRLLDSLSGVSGIPDPRFRGDDRLRSSLPPQIRPSSPGLTGRSSTPREGGKMMVVICANSLPTSSLRKQGPITTGVRCYERRLPSCPIELTRRRDERCRAHARGPRVRGDDEGMGKLTPC